MNYSEETAHFSCGGDTLLGILTKPATPLEVGVIVIVGGPQYRVGSHRQFVLLSRTLATAGYAVLRFDYRGMGDSEGEQRNFQLVNSDIAAAIDLLQERIPTVQRVALWGLCDGASAALLYCHETSDSRISHLCLLNPWVRSEASLAHTQVKHYYTKRLRQREFWLKLLSGKVALSALNDFVQKILLMASGSNQTAMKNQKFQQRMAAAWHSFPGHILLLLSGNDYTAKEFLEHTSKDPAWKNALAHPRVSRYELHEADHTFSDMKSRTEAEALTLEQGLMRPGPIH